jgi:hypothetical protein
MVDPFGSEQGPVVGCCEYGDEPSGSGAMDLVTYITRNYHSLFGYYFMKIVMHMK